VVAVQVSSGRGGKEAAGYLYGSGTAWYRMECSVCFDIMNPCKQPGETIQNELKEIGESEVCSRNVESEKIPVRESRGKKMSLIRINNVILPRRNYRDRRSSESGESKERD